MLSFERPVKGFILSFIDEGAGPGKAVWILSKNNLCRRQEAAAGDDEVNHIPVVYNAQSTAAT
jgi:hypothetical protein